MPTIRTILFFAFSQQEAVFLELACRPVAKKGTALPARSESLAFSYWETQKHTFQWRCLYFLLESCTKKPKTQKGYHQTSCGLVFRVQPLLGFLVSNMQFLDQMAIWCRVSDLGLQSMYPTQLNGHGFLIKDYIRD